MRLPDRESLGWVDGQRRPLREISFAVDDPAVHVGLGLFETAAIRDGRLLDLDEHLERLRESATALQINLDHGYDLRAVLIEEARLSGHRSGWLKLLVTRGGRTVVLNGAIDADEAGRPATAVILPWRKNPDDPCANHKTLNYAGNELGLEWARAHGADEGLWLNTRGRLAEGCMSNLFLLRGGAIFTPAIRDGILPGVIRRIVLAAAGDAGYTIHEGNIRLPRLLRCEEAFLSSSVKGIRSLLSVDGRKIGRGEPGQRTAELAGRVAKLRKIAE
ncbi:MAG: aminotransferase class IV [Acidobacteriota bacterium]|nr:aminotransferase class IV [Acidobacteriota bacterium]MDH3784834.1 aminotransferase class IV [Acidobacteriota bacterium]